MKNILLSVCMVLMLALASAAQISVPVKKGATLPATCDPANIQTLLFYKTGSNKGLYYCSATNTWTVTSLNGTVPVSSGGTGAVTLTGILKGNGTSAVTAVTAPSGTIVGSSDNQALTNKDLTGSGNTFPTFNQNTTGNAATVTTNANLTGPITSVGNATSVAAQTGTGSTFVMQTSPTLITPALGTPSALVGTNITGTASGLTAGSVTTNANLTGPITSTGNATAVAAQTGTGSTFVMQASPTLTTPILGAATATTLNGNTFTTGTYTLTGAASKTLTFNNSLTLAGTDSTTMTFPSTSATIARTDAANTFTGHQTIEGVTSTGATGSGRFVFDTSPTFTTSAISPLFTNTSAMTISTTGSNGNITLSPNGSGVISASRALVSPSNALTDNGTTIATNAALGNTFRVGALTANVTLNNPTNSSDGQRVVWEVIQNASAAKTLAFGANFAFGAEITGCTISTTLSSHNFITAIYNSTATKWYVVGCLTGY